MAAEAAAGRERGLRLSLIAVAMHPLFAMVILGVVTVNVVLMAAEHHAMSVRPPQSRTPRYAYLLLLYIKG